MNSVAAVVNWTGETATLESLKHCDPVKHIALITTPEAGALPSEHRILETGSLWSGSTVVDVLKWFEETGADCLLWALSSAAVLNRAGLKRLQDCAGDSGASLVYGDYYDRKADRSVAGHLLIDYQPGSLRDDFDFGPIVLIPGKSLEGIAADMRSESAGLSHGGWYDLRLRLSERGPIVHLPEPLYQLPQRPDRPSGQKVFDYVDPGRREYQQEMEQVATAYLKRIGAFLTPPEGPLVDDQVTYPLQASVVIPVKNRSRTIAEAVNSALTQDAPFAFNVIVVDNHSRDGTTEILEELVRCDQRLVHIRPRRKDLGIGGCWNAAIYSNHCGRIAVQLDSDDLYDGKRVLERMVAKFDENPYAMVIGAYTTVDFDLKPRKPGLVDHREWTDSNGPNNALRIAGLGAPRAFHVPTLRTIGFPNVSYGEDYAVALRLCRSYRVGRIFDPLYWCRRWEENTDAELSLEQKNRYDGYKDRLRTIEIAARRKKNNQR